MIKALLQRFRKPKRRTPAQRMLALQRAEVYYLPITKCGSTYLKNLFYYLDHAGEHPAGIAIHATPEDLQRAETGDEAKILQSPYTFAVLRDPVDRFVSLYFDKIYGDGPQNFKDVRRYLECEIDLDLTPNLNLEGHRKNCHRFIDWLALNLAHKTDQEINSHWRKQSGRLKRVKSLNLQHLTLEGLSWQLPMLLGDIIPDISQAMADVRADNRTHKPFKFTEIMDEGLRQKIETLYSADKKNYEAAKAKWQLRMVQPMAGDQTLCVMTAGALPLYCVTTPKVGCTYLKNLFFYLENGKAHPEPLRIHDDQEPNISRAVLGVKELAQGISFFVVRDPVDRFFSLYFEKVYNIGPQSFPWIAKRLVERRDYIAGPDISLEQHRINCIALLGFLKYHFTKDTVAKTNAHWRPQVETAKKVAGFGLTPLLLERLDEQLLQIADGRISGLAEAMAISGRNTSDRLFTNAEILTPEIANLISALYASDQALYERVKAGWDQTGQPPKL